MDEPKFAVVYFSSEAVYSEIPTSWLSQDKTKCWWPKSINPSMFMIRGDKPDQSTWDILNTEVEVFCSTLESARKKAADPEYSTSSEIEERGRGKRKKKVNTNKISPSESQTDSDDTAVTPPPSPKCRNNKSLVSEETVCAKSSFVVNEPAKFIDSSRNKNKTTFNEQDKRDKFNQHSQTSDINKQTTNDETLSTDLIQDIPVILVDEDGNVLDKLSEINNIPSGSAPNNGSITMKDLYSEIIHLKTICLSNQNYIKDIEKRLKSINRKDGEIIVDNHMKLVHGKIPLNTIEELQQFDTELRNSENMKNSFVNHIKTIGGRDSRDHLYRCLAQIFNNKLAVHCSWYGQRGNFKLNNLYFMSAITDVFLGLYKDTATQSQLEKFCSEWFRLSRQRLNREKK